jgi:hypothetical protein
LPSGGQILGIVRGIPPVSCNSYDTCRSCRPPGDLAAASLLKWQVDTVLSETVMVLGFFCLKTKICLMSVFIDSVEVSSSGRLCQRTPLDDMPRDCWIGWYSVVCIRIFSNRLVSKVAWRSSVVCYHHGTRLTVHGEVRCNGE